MFRYVMLLHAIMLLYVISLYVMSLYVMLCDSYCMLCHLNACHICCVPAVVLLPLFDEESDFYVRSLI
jgi:hypothetical protein